MKNGQAGQFARRFTRPMAQAAITAKSTANGDSGENVVFVATGMVVAGTGEVCSPAGVEAVLTGDMVVSVGITVV